MVYRWYDKVVNPIIVYYTIGTDELCLNCAIKIIKTGKTVHTETVYSKDVPELYCKECKIPLQ